MKAARRTALTALLFAAGALTLAPLFWALARSLEGQGHPLAAYAAALEAAPLLRYGLNSTLIAATTALGQTVVAALAGYAFARLHFRGRDGLFLLFLVTLLVPPQVTLLPTFLLIKLLGLLNTGAAVVVPSLVHPFTIFMVRQALLAMSSEIEDAARIDGCSRLAVFWHMAVPFAAPSLIATALFSFLWSWNSFTWPLIALQDPKHYTLPVGLAMLSGELGSDWTTLMAGAVMTTLPIAVLFLALQRQFGHSSEVGGMPSV
jgi:multiple sugar transport system permease protein